MDLLNRFRDAFENLVDKFKYSDTKSCVFIDFLTKEIYYNDKQNKWFISDFDIGRWKRDSPQDFDVYLRSQEKYYKSHGFKMLCVETRESTNSHIPDKDYYYRREYTTHHFRNKCYPTYVCKEL